jgi:hypothetical protein
LAKALLDLIEEGDLSQDPGNHCRALVLRFEKTCGSCGHAGVSAARAASWAG